MIVSPETILFTIKALARLGTAARESYENSVTGQEISLPGVDLKPFGAANSAASRLDNALLQDEISLPAAELSDLKSDVKMIIRKQGSEDDRFLAGNRVIRHARRLYPNLVLDTRGAGVYIIQQWGAKGKPATPIARIGLVLVEVGLDYLAVNPGRIGLGGNTDKLIAGVAANLRDLLPDPDDLGAMGNEFAEESIRIFVQAGLITLDQKMDTIVEKESLQELSKAVLKPIIDTVAAGDSGMQRWYDIRDELLGPISEAAIGVLARHQGALLGKSIDTDTAVGSVTHSILLAVKENGLDDDFGREGLLRVYRAALDVAIEQPGLFLGQIEGTDIGQKLLSDAAKLIKEQSPPFNTNLAVELTAVAIASIGKNAPALFVYNGNWGALATAAAHTVIREVSAGLAEGVRNGKADILGRLFNQDQASQFFKILVDQAAANPGMIIGTETAPELKLLTEIIVRAMAEQNQLLLTADNWLVVAATVAREVGQNPNRLIQLDARGIETQLAYQLISKLLQAAATDFEQVGRKDGSVLFGETLAQVINDAIVAAAGNAANALKHCEALGSLTNRLNLLNKSNPGRIGKREWRYLFRRLVADALDTGKLPDHTDAHLLGLLANL